jgi:hypothetical protein
MYAEFLQRYDADQQHDANEDPQRAAEIRSALEPMVAYAKRKTDI